MDRIAQEAIEAHRQLDADIEKLRDTIRKANEGEARGWCEVCTEQFRRFHTHLRRHIEMEETDGFLRPVTQRRPTLTPQVDQLKREHRELILSCEQIEHDLEKSAAPTPDLARDLQRRITELIEALVEHENAENKMVQEVFNQDIGAGD